MRRARSESRVDWLVVFGKRATRPLEQIGICSAKRLPAQVLCFGLIFTARHPFVDQGEIGPGNCLVILARGAKVGSEIA